MNFVIFKKSHINFFFFWNKHFVPAGEDGKKMENVASE